VTGHFACVPLPSRVSILMGLSFIIILPDYLDIISVSVLRIKVLDFIYFPQLLQLFCPKLIIPAVLRIQQP
jgi:hypothetical protein